MGRRTVVKKNSVSSMEPLPSTMKTTSRAVALMHGPPTKRGSAQLTGTVAVGDDVSNPAPPTEPAGAVDGEDDPRRAVVSPKYSSSPAPSSE